MQVPKCIKCCVVGDTKVARDATGFKVVKKSVVLIEALVVNLAVIFEFQV